MEVTDSNVRLWLMLPCIPAISAVRLISLEDDATSPLGCSVRRLFFLCMLCGAQKHSVTSVHCQGTAPCARQLCGIFASICLDLVALQYWLLEMKINPIRQEELLAALCCSCCVVLLLETVKMDFAIRWSSGV